MLKSVKFNYDLSNFWDHYLLTAGNHWMDSEIEGEILMSIDKNGIEATVNNIYFWNKIGINLLDMTVVMEDGIVRFNPPSIDGYLGYDAERMVQIGKILGTLKGLDRQPMSFPSTTIISITKGKIVFSSIDKEIASLIGNIAYNTIVLLLILNIPDL